jgi:hypothetical protein
MWTLIEANTARVCYEKFNLLKLLLKNPVENMASVALRVMGGVLDKSCLCDGCVHVCLVTIECGD